MRCMLCDEQIRYEPRSCIWCGKTICPDCMAEKNSFGAVCKDCTRWNALTGGPYYVLP